VAQVALFEADALERAVEAEHAVRQIGVGAWIEKRLAGDSARAPVFGDFVRFRQAEIGKELLRRQSAEILLRQQGDLAPSGRIGDPLRIDALQASLVKWRAKRVLDRDDFAFLLKCRDLGT
jgi:hypothetical protein